MITIESLDKSHSTDVVKILIDSFSKNYDKKINESIFSSDEVDGIVALEKGNVLGYASIHYINKITRKSGIIEDVVVKNGFSVVEDYTGHGVGRNLHEEPSVFNFRTKELPNVVLREGMTLAVEPIVNEGTKHCKTLNDRWTVITKDGKLSAQWEHTIVVLKDGIEILTDRDF